MEFRPERGGDEHGIRCVHLAAFPTAVEANLVEQLKRNGDAVISFVAIDDDQVVGHVLLSRMYVEADGQSLSALGLGPVGVSPEHQRSGIGSALIRAALAVAHSQSTRILFVLGEPAFYARFGFDARTAAPFSSPYAGPYFQALVLDQHSLCPRRARADYAPAFADIE